jgi:Family of unknown function (DUF6668)
MGQCGAPFRESHAPDEVAGFAGGDRKQAGRRQGGVEPLPLSQRLGRRQLNEREWPVSVWWVGAHGGAGESTLEELYSGSRAAGHEWPLQAIGKPPARVVLVARTHASGLMAAQRAIRDWAAGDVPVLLLGLLLIADAPGRLPHGLRQLAALIAGGAPAVWSLPWIEAWRIGDPPDPSNTPEGADRLLEDLQAMTEAADPLNANRNEEE